MIMNVVIKSRFGILYLLFCIGILTIVWCIYKNSVETHYIDYILKKDVDSRNSKPAPRRSKSHRPKILIWTKLLGPFRWTFSDLPDDHGGCDIIYDRAEYTASDAIVFLMPTCQANDLPDPRKRKPHQVYVWHSHEAPWLVLNHWKHDLNDFNNYFNWTITYRSNSDVIAAYVPVPALDYFLLILGRKEEIRNKSHLLTQSLSELDFELETKELLAKKKKFAAWAVGNCKSTTHARSRIEYADNLSKENLKIDRFGLCSENKLPFKNSVVFQTLSSYKFYLAFENSLHCQDYITEKSFYNGLVSGTVPIIYGPTIDSAKRMLPKGSYIHTENFKSPHALAQYLKYLDGNNTAYLEYFEWWKNPGAKTYPRFGFNYGSEPSKNLDEKEWKWNAAIEDDLTDSWRVGFYHLCRKLKNGDNHKTSKVISSMHQLWFGVEQKECTAK